MRKNEIKKDLRRIVVFLQEAASIGAVIPTCFLFVDSGIFREYQKFIAEENILPSIEDSVHAIYFSKDIEDTEDVACGLFRIMMITYFAESKFGIKL